jgi:hypothetical protein
VLVSDCEALGQFLANNLIGDGQQTLFVNQVSDEIGAGDRPGDQHDGALFAIAPPRWTRQGMLGGWLMG